MVKKCYVYSCRSESFAGCNISFHKFPTDPALKKKWLVAIKRETVAKNSVVCSRHFNVEDYLNPYTSKLKPTAVPSVGTPEDGDDSITKICRVCLAIDVKMYEINEFYLELFESVTGIADDELKHEVYQNLCYECVARLTKFNAFKDKALLADSLFQGLLQTGDVIKAKHIQAIQQNYSVFRPNLTIKWIYPPLDFESGEDKTNIKLEHVVDDKITPAVEELKAQFGPVKIVNKAKTDVNNKNIGVKVVNTANADIKRTVTNAVVVQNAKIDVQTKSVKAKNTVLKTNRETDTKVKVESSRIADENESDFCDYEFLEDEVVGKESLANYSERQIKQEYFNDDESITIDEKNIKDEILSDNDGNSNAGDDFNNSDFENDDDVGRTYLTLDNRSSDDDTNYIGDQSFVIDNINADIIETIKEIVINPIDEENSSNNNNSTVIDHDYFPQDNAIENREQTEREKDKTEIAKKKIVEKTKKVLSKKKFEDDNILIGLEEATDEYRKCVKFQMAILKRLETSEFVAKRPAKNSLDLSLFTVTKRSYQEQLHDIEKRKDTQKYKEAPYKCEICFLPYYKARTLDLHMERHTDVWGKLECFICKMRLRNRKGLLQHLTVRHVHYYKCNKCSFGAMTRFAARSHVAYHKSKIYQCKHCNKVFTKPSSYLGHLRLKHLCDFVCELCGYMFLSKHGVSTHKCLKHANEINKLEGPYCKTCDVTFASQEAHDRHLRLSSRHTVESAPDRLRNEQITPRNFVNPKYTRLRKCQYCSLMFSNRGDYNAHIEAKHPEVHAAIEARNKERIKKKCPNTMCEHCGKLFPTKMHLRNHMWVHTGDKYYKCTRCPKSFTSLNALKCHALYKHEGSKANAVCPICGKTLLHASNLQKHMFSHTGQKRHICTICEKKFTWRHELTSHVKHVHLNVPWPKRVRQRRKEPKTPEEE